MFETQEPIFGVRASAADVSECDNVVTITTAQYEQLLDDCAC